MAPGAVVSEIARRHGMRPQHLFTWVRRAGDSGGSRLRPIISRTPGRCANTPRLNDQLRVGFLLNRAKAIRRNFSRTLCPVQPN
jgi:transposase-like protein